MTRNEQQMYHDITNIAESLKEIAKTLEELKEVAKILEEIKNNINSQFIKGVTNG